MIVITLSLIFSDSNCGDAAAGGGGGGGVDDDVVDDDDGVDGGGGHSGDGDGGGELIHRIATWYLRKSGKLGRAPGA